MTTHASLTTVVNCRKEPFDVYIGRGSIWGNPFRIGDDGMTRQDVIEAYEKYIKCQPQLLEQLPSLVGKRLGCFCAPDACHGDVLKRLAEEMAWERVRDG